MSLGGRSCHPRAAGRRRWVVIALIASLAPSACGLLRADLTTPDVTPTVPPGFVQRSGHQLVVDGRPFFFTGMNIYNAANSDLPDTRSCWYSMSSGDTLDRSLTALGPGVEAIRTWFFQNQGTGSNGQRDWSTLDHTLAVAKKHGMRVIPVLADQWGYCEGAPRNNGGYKTEQWYRSGYRSVVPPGMLVTYRDWVREAVTRYRSDPTILAWQLVNEAEAGTNERDCSRTAMATLIDFATDMSEMVKSVDPYHLLSLGTIGTGQCGLREDQYETVHAVHGIDLCEYHDYDDPGSPIPGDKSNGMAVRLRQCKELGKPLINGEIGLNTGDADNTYAGRARLLDAKLRAQRDAGVAGALVWTWRNAEHGGSSNHQFYVGPGDPMLAVLRRY
jgi:mannan endo-1,4-beta-mannosidase